MRTRIQLSDIPVDVIRKDIKNVHLSVHPPTGRVRIAAPERMSLDTVRVFAIAKVPWIRKQQRKLREQERETPREYIDRESHYVWGKRYLLKVVEADQPPEIHLNHGRYPGRPLLSVHSIASLAPLARERWRALPCAATALRSVSSRWIISSRISTIFLGPGLTYSLKPPSQYQSLAASALYVAVCQLLIRACAQLSARSSNCRLTSSVPAFS
jgi:Protein of unknown function DUF45